jgi:hypothetical protein
VHALELSGEGLDFQPDTLLELVLLLEQLQQLGGGKPNAPVTKSLLAG